MYDAKLIDIKGDKKIQEPLSKIVLQNVQGIELENENGSVSINMNNEGHVRI